jgi:hypothetical protein
VPCSPGAFRPEGIILILRSSHASRAIGVSHKRHMVVTIGEELFFGGRLQSVWDEAIWAAQRTCHELMPPWSETSTMVRK